MRGGGRESGGREDWRAADEGYLVVGGSKCLGRERERETSHLLLLEAGQFSLRCVALLVGVAVERARGAGRK